MKLSELVKLRNELKKVSFVPTRIAVDDLDSHLSRLTDLLLRLDFKEQISNVINTIDEVENKLCTAENQIPEMIKQIELELEERTKDYLNTNYTINGIQYLHHVNVTGERTNRILPMNNGTRSDILVRARKYTDWRFPALEIGPGDGEWTEHLIAGDPLYILDMHQEFIDNTLNKFNPVYRNRIRPYVVGANGISDTDFSILPQGQFGFIFAWNVFNYFPLEYAKTILTNCMSLLRPGGCMMFSYNNCDIVQCAEYAEQGLASWIPQTILSKTCTDLGFEIINFSDAEETVHWIEIKKPGELKTVKAHQVLGEIVSA